MNVRCPQVRGSTNSDADSAFSMGLSEAITQGGGEQDLSTFALVFHATPFHLGILSAIPQLLGSWAQLVSVKVSHWFPSHTSQIFWSIIGQSVFWIPILPLPLL
jgi:hypothetical protein